MITGDAVQEKLQIPPAAECLSEERNAHLEELVHQAKTAAALFPQFTHVGAKTLKEGSEREMAQLRRGSEKKELIRVKLAGKGVARPVLVNRWSRITLGYAMSTPDMVRIGLTLFY
jgi:hypothetical protein